MSDDCAMRTQHEIVNEEGGRHVRHFRGQVPRVGETVYDGGKPFRVERVVWDFTMSSHAEAKVFVRATRD